MADGRFVGHAQRRRMGASANVMDDASQAPTFGVGDSVTAKGRYGVQKVDSVMPNVAKPSFNRDGHLYFVSGGKGGRQTSHFSDEIHTHLEDPS